MRRGFTAPWSQIGTADVDWDSLKFAYVPAKFHFEATWRDGKWSEGRLVDSPYVNLHIASTCLHYGQACFEGLKAFSDATGGVSLFRPDQNGLRMNRSAERLCMQPPPPDLFLKGCEEVVRANAAFVPPFETQGALYIRPLLVGSGPRIGVEPSDEYTFIVLAMPCGDYYKGGVSKPVSAWVVDGYDRAAPQGVGAFKVGGNYAADLQANGLGKKKGHPVALYLDAKEQKFIDEFSTSNFIAFEKGKDRYVTPQSPSILPSITNLSLMDLARDQGWEVVQRPVEIAEVLGGRFSEVAACGTAVVITPLSEVEYRDSMYRVSESTDEKPMGPAFSTLYRRLRAVQRREDVDTHGWLHRVL
uniref:Branched-chain-amino-acid transaminase n=1 Tax=Chromera velia CCMP2878 TaxID=1169474 RepID=A0A0G4FZR6_9ALVE|eukprot:Cvel_3924.t1-p1 / transcript=Cvel_3924.t1 / gene=Cvel_3924 / organism=Chromera_velia_CCMP2878 / gene_product=Branched-chain-amino-acid aminotransferase, putative / transcript_product=Branched-chain-amino-acid aminotransferase, putative / location=Cvel_scaffold166:89661-94099(+) / protein_length=358 / sequence_SO=supercontig / SO=protein_coding / is_pseudo=false